jgi:tetratricopeptide (TPR) repeat protein
MDGRKLFILGAFALGVCTGCVPPNAKTANLEAPASTPMASDAALVSAPALNLFGGEKPKKAPNLELSFAEMREKQARTFADQPQKQFSEFDEARKIYHEILNYDPNCIEAYRGLGRVYTGLGDYERAAASFQKAIEKQPKCSVLYAEFSIVYSKRNQFPEAVRLLSKATELDPENQEFQRMLAVDLVCNGQLEQGLAAMTRARGPAAAHYYIARVYERKGRPDLARTELARALQANPNLQEARAMLDDLSRPQTATASTTPAVLPATAPVTHSAPTQAELSFTSFDGR